MAGKSMKLGGGGRFAKIEAKAKASGAKNPPPLFQAIADPVDDDDGADKKGQQKPPGI